MARLPNDKTPQDALDRALGLGRNNADPIDAIASAFLSVKDLKQGQDFFDRFAAYGPLSKSIGGQGPNTNKGLQGFKIDPSTTMDVTRDRRSILSAQKGSMEIAKANKSTAPKSPSKMGSY